MKVRMAVLALSCWLAAATAGWADPVRVHVLADPSLRGGTIYTRPTTSVQWDRAGLLVGPPMFDAVVLQQSTAYEIKVEKVGFWTIESGHAFFTPMAGAPDTPEVSIPAEPPSANISSVLLKLVLPILVVLVLGGIWLYRKRGKPNESQAHPIRSYVADRDVALPVDYGIGPYRVVRNLGADAMVTMYEVQDDSGARYAIKVPLRAAMSDPEYASRFRREAKVCIGLAHPNIVRIVDSGTAPDPEGRDTPYLVLELIHGHNLSIMIQDSLKSGRPPDLEFAAWVTQGVLSGLSAAHALGITHRDVEPEHVIVTDAREIKLTGFGIARMTRSKTMTIASGLVGATDYMAPEQITNPGKVDHRADLYSTGIMLYLLATNELPYKTEGGDLWTVIMEKTRQQVKPPRQLNPSIPVAMDSLIMRLLENKPEKRFESAVAALNALAWMRSHPDESLPVTDFQTPV